MAKWPYNTTAWRKLRLAKLESQPLCEPCERRGIIVPAVAVDHVTSIASGGDPFPPLSGLMSMCLSCHSIKTNAVDRPGGKGVRFKGVGVDGLPIDPDHPAMRPAAAAPAYGVYPLQGRERRGPGTGGGGTCLFSSKIKKEQNQWD